MKDTEHCVLDEFEKKLLKQKFGEEIIEISEVIGNTYIYVESSRFLDSREVVILNCLDGMGKPTKRPLSDIVFEIKHIISQSGRYPLV